MAPGNYIHSYSIPYTTFTMNRIGSDVLREDPRFSPHYSASTNNYVYMYNYIMSGQNKLDCRPTYILYIGTGTNKNELRKVSSITL